MTAPTCPICEGDRVHSFLQRKQVPVHQNLAAPTPAEARAVTRGELALMVCEDCGFVFNRAFDLSLLSYGEHYDNTQSCSPSFDRYMDELVRDLVENKGVRNCNIVEVGCGKGGFLRKLVAYPGANNRGIGFDPSYVGPDDDLDGRLRFRRCYYDDACTDVGADVVICRHVIEHVPQPRALLKSVRGALARAPNARVFFETPCITWILRNQVVWDLFYEHCSLFSTGSLRVAFERCGFTVSHIKHVFGDQYLWLEATVAHPLKPSETRMTDTASLANRYGLAERMLRDQWRAKLIELRSEGRIALWGAGAKGATFANLVDPDQTLIDCVVDLNPNKQGRFIPGTGHAIVSPTALPARGVTNAILMNPNYREENLHLLAKADIQVNLIEWS